MWCMAQTWVLDPQTKQGTTDVEDVLGQMGALNYGLHIIIR